MCGASEMVCLTICILLRVMIQMKTNEKRRKGDHCDRLIVIIMMTPIYDRVKYQLNVYKYNMFIMNGLDFIFSCCESL